MAPEVAVRDAVWVRLDRAASTSLVVLFGLWLAVLVATATTERNLDPVLQGLLLGFLVVAAVRPLVAAVRRPAQRTALLALSTGILLWDLASLVVLTTTSPGVVTLPLSPAEWLMVAAFVGFASFVLLDARARTEATRTAILEAVVITGGSASLAAGVLMAPIANADSDLGASAILVAWLYPIFGLFISLLVIAQMAMGQRRADLRSALIVAAFICLATADATFARTLSDGSYVSGTITQMLWGAGLLLVAQGASLRRREAAEGPRGSRRIPVVLAGGVALLVSALPLPVARVWWVQIPALITLAGVILLLLHALQEQRQATQALRLAHMDVLTGLPNHRALLTRITQSRTDQTLIMFTPDSFADITESFGYPAADSVLILLGQRLRESLPPKATAARLEGPVFAALLEAPDDPETVAHQIRAAVFAPIPVEDLAVVLDPLMGIAVSEPGESGGDLLRRASLALGQAKRQPARLQWYAPAQDGVSREHLRKAERLRQALSEGEIVAFYQPQIDLTDGSLVGLEALARWREPGLPALTPAGFLPTARRAGLMPALTEAIMTQVVQDAVRWTQQGRTWRVSLNIDPPELLGGTAVHSLGELLQRTHLPAGTLVVEVTEGTFLSDPTRALAVLAGLRALGVEVSVDDYGTGFSSLAYLRDLRASELKIDRSFITDMQTDRTSRLIVSSTVQMAHNLGIRVVAEGVEDAATAEDLRRIGVDVVQGFHYSRALDPADLAAWITHCSLSG